MEQNAYKGMERNEMYLSKGKEWEIMEWNGKEWNVMELSNFDWMF